MRPTEPDGPARDGPPANGVAARPGPPRTRRVTHRDVARRAGVSPAVVSYVINNGPRAASPAARARVLQAIQELDYHPNAVARGLRAQRTHTVGFLACDYSPLDVFVSPYSAGVLTGLAAEVNAHGYYLLVHPMMIGQEVRSLGRLLRSGRLDGVIVRLVEAATAHESDALLELIAAAGLPCVCLERPPDPRFGFDSVLFDNVAGAEAATRLLVESGHRRIAHLQGDPLYESARERRRGYEQALVSAGLAVDPALISGDSWDPTTVDDGIERLIGLPEPPTAIFAANDNLAFRAIGVLHLLGRRVPEDVAVVGFDDIPLAHEMVPPLSTVRIPLDEIGRRAARRLLELIDTSPPDGQPPSEPPGSGQSELIVPHLVRRSTA